MKRIIPLVILLLLTSIFLIGRNNVLSEPEELENKSLRVDSLLRRYGRQEVIVLRIENPTDMEVVFPDNLYGMNLFKRQDDGYWKEILNPLPLNSTIFKIQSQENVELKIDPNTFPEGEYRVVFEGWPKDDFATLIKGETMFSVQSHPTFRVELAQNNVRANNTIELFVTNDRSKNIKFNDSTLDLKLFILNEEDEWMELPSPLYNDHTPFELEPGEKYSITIPALRASGNYRVTLSGIDEDGMELRSQLDIRVR